MHATQQTIEIWNREELRDCKRLVRPLRNGDVPGFTLCEDAKTGERVFIETAKIERALERKTKQ